MVTFKDAGVRGKLGLRGLVVTVIFGEGDTVESDFNEIRTTLVQWQSRYGELCCALDIEYFAPSKSAKGIEEFWLEKSQSDDSLLKLFVAIRNVDLCILTPDGSNILRIGFEYGSPR